MNETGSNGETPAERAAADRQRFHDYIEGDRRKGAILREMIGTAIVVIPMFLGGLMYVITIDQKTALNTQAIQTLREQRVEFLSHIDKIDDKIDAVRYLIQQTAEAASTRGRAAAAAADRADSRADTRGR